MANFAPPAFGAAFARSANVQTARESTRIQREQLRATKAEQAQENLRSAYERSESSANEAFDKGLEILQDAAQAGATPEQLGQMNEALMLGPNSHAVFLATLRAQARAAGATDDEMAILPSPGEYIEMKRQVLAGATELAQLTANRPDAGTQFFADVDAADLGIQQAGVRVTSQTQADQSVKFFVGDTEVPASAITQPVQKTQDVIVDQIPGLTPAQSGTVITELTESAAANEAFATIAQRVVEQTAGQPEKIGIVGTILRGLDVVTQQAEAVSNALGLPSRYDGDIESFNFRGLAGESQEVKTRLLDLVFLNLASKGQTGRSVSDRDLQIFMDATGFGTGSPQLIARGLKSAVEDNQISLKSQILHRGRGALRVDQIVQGGFKDLDLPGMADPKQVEDLLRRANEAAEAENFEEAARLLDELDALGSN